MCLGVFLLCFILFETLCAPWTWLTISFSMLGKFSTIISSKIFSHPFFFFSSSSSGTPIINSNVGVFDMVPEVSETVFSSFHSLYFILLFRIYFHNFIFQLSNLCFWFKYSAIDSFWSKVKSLSRIQLFVTPWTVAYQVPPSMVFSRQEYWSGLPFPSPGDLPNPGIEPGSPTF